MVTSHLVTVIQVEMETATETPARKAGHPGMATGTVVREMETQATVTAILEAKQYRQV
jgi:hypothetical protein